MVLALTGIAIAVIFGFLIYGARQGTACVLATALLLLLAWSVAVDLAPLAAHAVGPEGLPLAEHLRGEWMRNIFLALAPVALFAGGILKRYVPLNFEAFDGLIGTLFGIGAGFLAAHLLLLAFLAAAVGTPAQAPLARSTAVRQLVHFDALHGLHDLLTGQVERNARADGAE